ncbi:ACT domain-containing protein [Hwanghaeella grinnelliae]|uniref:ACT domain-containing protein n=1 Tax=Hwanghaeella grinnelliae TaxID=2500179 RepID=A0A437QMY8_9PROT|nr:ACT domain-containing protein [Hwanghaeella grinnelliae]RVU35911.1 ACT domain-containing protein [Hwanghaeella grinnelliae]
MGATVDLRLLEGFYAVSFLPPDSAVPNWVTEKEPEGGFVNVSFCNDEISIVTPADRVPDGVETDKGWRALKLTGAFAFDQPGIVLSVVRPISEAELGVFVVSTFHRDYLLVRSESLEKAQALLTEAGHRWA